ncbi:hypothetical protein FGO68_gene14728 [Halteria grandinella]|uniref:Uncharacterized protein n=1 Tax=Halteria grandinella TaxID=5974 RepID=A0A8J8NXC9_HALGN|nr:hypothetical protein FGO68_gene14728 [Halteria grandinella]
MTRFSHSMISLQLLKPSMISSQSMQALCKLMGQYWPKKVKRNKRREIMNNKRWHRQSCKSAFTRHLLRSSKSITLMNSTQG